jgi:hypothetical protein
VRMGNLVHMKQHSCTIACTHKHHHIHKFQGFLVSLDDIILSCTMVLQIFCLVCKQDGIHIHYKQQGIEALIIL